MATLLPQNPNTMSIELLYTIPLVTITGEPTTLSVYRGQVMLLVNVASECGYTIQYEALEQLYKTHKDRGLVIIGFPANNFDEQEPGTNAEIAHFCKSKFGVTFPLMSKISVLGADIHPLYKLLTATANPQGDVEWNFEKFLLARDGMIAARYRKRVKPDDAHFVGMIEELLGKSS